MAKLGSLISDAMQSRQLPLGSAMWPRGLQIFFSLRYCVELVRFAVRFGCWVEEAFLSLCPVGSPLTILCLSHSLGRSTPPLFA